MRKSTVVMGAIIAMIFTCVAYTGCSENYNDKGKADEESLGLSGQSVTTIENFENRVTKDEIDMIEFKEDLIQGNVTSTMSLVKTSNIDLNGISATIELYTDNSAEFVASDVILEDGQLWSLLVRMDKFVYPLIHKQYVKNGEINYWAYGSSVDDTTRGLVIYTAVEQSVGFAMKEFVFEPDELVFVKNDIAVTNIETGSLIGKSEKDAK